ncbi:MAG: hypothetical protein QGG73_13345, partial [Candidatus Hydrogenedentes bacterium]|nr:hypothetical protein [Candidatus Hydrogenedentota bacterium]
MLTTDGARRDVSLRLTAALGGWPSCAALAAAFVLVSAAVSAQAPDLTKMDVVLRSVPDGPIARVNGVSITATVFIKLYSDRLAKIEK